MGWHSRSPSVIKHGTDVTLQHPRQTGLDNEPPSLGSVGTGVWRRRRWAWYRAAIGVGWLDLGSGCPRLTHSRLSLILQEEGLREMMEGLLIFA